MRDIIALATKCGFSTVEDRTIYLSKYSKEKLHDCILKLATLLEAEIRKEYEGVIKAYERDIEKAVAESVKAGIGEHSPEAAIATLAYQRDEAIEQNAKLMAALDLYCPGHILLNPERLAIIEPIIDELIAALTQQEVKK